MITLYLAEKPSMARDIAHVLGARKKEPSKWVGDGVWVSWCLGHLVELATPADHDERWKSWRASALPILPERLLWVPTKKTRAHLKAVSALLKSRQVSRVVNACDAGREGELIFRTVYAHSGSRAPVERFWVSSLTPSAIRAGLNALRPGADFDPLAAAAYCRSEADWLVGMNATRALTSRASDLLSVGRVQTPTLSLLVSREQELRSFVPEDYWTLSAELEARCGARWRAHWRGPLNAQLTPPQRAQEGEQSEQAEQAEQGRFKRREEAEEVARRARSEQGRVTRCEGKERATPPPLLLHLTALQQTCNRRFGYSADQTLSFAQALYERHKLLSYPRTDSRHLTPDVAATLPKVVSAVSQAGGALGQGAQALLSSGLPKLGRRFVNAQKVTDHHALVPTAKPPNLSALSEGERRVYELIARSTLAALSPDAIDFVVTLDAELAGGLWRARGRIEREPGWRVHLPPARSTTSEGTHKGSSSEGGEEEQLLPRVEVGAEVRALEVDVQARQTQPPKRYSEASLLGAMEHAGRRLEQRELKEALKGSGLGTPATRASILETLLRRGYAYREGKVLRASEAGEALINALGELSAERAQALCSPELTAAWEQRLQQVADGNAPAERFMSEVRAWVAELTEALTQGSHIHVPQSAKGAKGARRGARRAPQASSPSRASSAPQGSALSTPPPPKTTRSKLPTTVVGLPCPRCQQGALVQGQRGWGCERWREGCHFVIWFIVDGVEVPEEEALRVAAKGKSRLFVEREGRRWRLCVDLSAPSGLRWEPNTPKGSQKAPQKKPPNTRKRATSKGSKRTHTSTPNTHTLGPDRWRKRP